jgi:hypothetical protein
VLLPLPQDVTIGLILISVVTYFCFAFSGFIVQPIPGYFVWLHKVSYYSLAYTALVHNEFTGLQLRSPIDQQVRRRMPVLCMLSESSARRGACWQAAPGMQCAAALA